MSIKSILITYLIGGITFLPLLVIAALYLLYVVLPPYVDDEEIDQDNKDDDLSEFTTNEYENLKMTELEEKQTSGVKAFKSGWVTVTREYHTFVSNANDKQLEGKEQETKSAYTALYRLVKNNKKQSQQNDAGDASTTGTTPNASSANVDKNIKKAVRRKNRYYGVLRHGNLFLYKDENQQDVQHVIVLSNNIVTLWPRDLEDSELFTKRSAICILKRQARTSSDSPPKESSASLGTNMNDVESTFDILRSGVIPPKNTGFFIYCDTNYEKEDWYFELIKATKRDNFQPTNTDLDLVEPSIYANALHFKTSDIINLIQTLHSSEGQLQTRWLNALLGRIFLSVQFTEYFENIVRVKLLKKLAKINKPGFLDEIKVKKIDVGNSAPFISFPKLTELNPDGTLKLAMKFSYTGKLSLQVSTKANINLGSHFKAREVNILLAVTLNKIEGPMIVHVKPPPSTRIWYTFESMPTLDMTIEPVVSQRQLTYGMITKVIENKFREGIKDSLVLPHWDDITFFNTYEELYRGGIWDTTKRPDDTDTSVVSEADEEEILNGDDDLLTNTDLTEGLDSELKSDATKLDSKSPTFNARDNDDISSLKSKATTSDSLRSGGSLTNSLAGTKKTTPSIGTSSEQFLSNGSYVSRDSSAPTSPIKEANTFPRTSSSNKSDETLNTIDKERSFSRNNTLQLLSEEANASKKTISNSFKKIGKWYEKNRNASSTTIRTQDSETPSTSSKPYMPPEMIQSRRRAPSSSDSTKRQPRRTISTNTLNSQDSNSSLKAAPHAHSFPAEYLYGLEPSAPDSESGMKYALPPKIPEMKSPYESSGSPPSASNSPPKEESPASPNKPHYPRRKPVEEDIAAKVPSQAQSGPPALPKREIPAYGHQDIVTNPTSSSESKKVDPGDDSLSTTTSAPPPLPAREIVAEDKPVVESSKLEEEPVVEPTKETESNLVGNKDSYEADLKRALEASLHDEEVEKDSLSDALNVKAKDD